MSEMTVLDVNGDTKTIWNPENADEVEAARKTFDGLKAKRYIAYQVKEDGTKGTIMNNFDPHAAKVILSPPMAGG